MHYILFYDVVDDYVTKRAAYRAAHLEQVREAHAQGDLVLAGALTNPPDRAVLVFRSAQAAESFAKADTYVLHQLVKNWHVREWATVVGDGATMPPLS